MSDNTSLTPVEMDPLQELIDSEDFAKNIQHTENEVYTSFQPTDTKGKKILYRAMSNPDKKLNDCFNMEIRMKDIFCETVPIKKDNETRMCPRIVIIDDKGVSYQSVSFGVYNSLKRIIQIFGLPTWEEPITIVPKQISKDGTNKITTLEIK